MNYISLNDLNSELAIEHEIVLNVSVRPFLDRKDDTELRARQTGHHRSFNLRPELEKKVRMSPRADVLTIHNLMRVDNGTAALKTSQKPGEEIRNSRQNRTTQVSASVAVELVGHCSIKTTPYTPRRSPAQSKNDENKKETRN